MNTTGTVIPCLASSFNVTLSNKIDRAIAPKSRKAKTIASLMLHLHSVPSLSISQEEVAILAILLSVPLAFPTPQPRMARAAYPCLSHRSAHAGPMAGWQLSAPPIPRSKTPFCSMKIHTFPEKNHVAWPVLATRQRVDLRSTTQRHESRTNVQSRNRTA